MCFNLKADSSSTDLSTALLHSAMYSGPDHVMMASELTRRCTVEGDPSDAPAMQSRHSSHLLRAYAGPVRTTADRQRSAALSFEPASGQASRASAAAVAEGLEHSTAGSSVQAPACKCEAEQLQAAPWPSRLLARGWETFMAAGRWQGLFILAGTLLAAKGTLFEMAGQFSWTQAWQIAQAVLNFLAVIGVIAIGSTAAAEA